MKALSLFEYPVKGLRGNALACASVNKRGLATDRRWMLVDDVGNFLSQRQLPALTQFISVYENHLIIKHLPSAEERTIDSSAFTELLAVTVWGQQCAAHGAIHDISQWLSNLLKSKVNLVYMQEHDVRPIKSSKANDMVSFADGYPVLLTTSSSLAELNGRLSEPIKMDRFRANIIIDGDLAYAEDTWQRIKIGEVTFSVAKLCARCHVINIDQESGLATKEPLKTLSTYRQDGNRVNFGINLIPENTGIIHQHDEVVVLA